MTEGHSFKIIEYLHIENYLIRALGFVKRILLLIEQKRKKAM